MKPSLSAYALERLDRWVGRVRSQWRLRSSEVGVWYHEDYSFFREASTQGIVQPRRGDLVLGRLVHDGFIRPDQVCEPGLVDFDEVSRFHSWSYIETTTHAETLARIFGVLPDAIHVTDILQSVRRAVAGTTEAAQAVSSGRIQVGVNLGGGFHHAEPDAGSGFCVYNDIGIAIRRLRQNGYTGRILIVDLDVHQGNGNTAAFQGTADSVHVFSIHGSRWNRDEGTEHLEIHLSTCANDDRYLAALRTTLPSFLDRTRPELVFYLAGADVLAEDRLGTFALSLEGIFERDRLVTEWVRDWGAGMVVTLGGGYSRSAWVAHYNFVRFLLTGSSRMAEVERGGQALEKSFDRIAQALTESELQGGAMDLSLDDSELFGQLARQPMAYRFLDYYSESGLRTAMERYGIFQAIKDRGFTQLQTTVDASNPERQSIVVDAHKDGQQHRLVELVARKRTLEVEDQNFTVMHVEWLLLQDPTAQFGLDRPKLPGQAHPGLGLSMVVTEMLRRSCIRLGLAGLTHRPAHFHNAQGAPRSFTFIRPQDEGLRRALGVVLSGMTVGEASRAVEAQKVKYADGSPAVWDVHEHVLAVNEDLQAFFRNDRYRSEVTRVTQELLQRGLHLE